MTLDYCNGIKVIHTSEHVPRHTCLYLKQSKTLIAGDALIVKNNQMSLPEPEYTIDMNIAI